MAPLSQKERQVYLEFLVLFSCAIGLFHFKLCHMKWHEKCVRMRYCVRSWRHCCQKGLYVFFCIQRVTCTLMHYISVRFCVSRRGPALVRRLLWLTSPPARSLTGALLSACCLVWVRCERYEGSKNNSNSDQHC